MSPGRHAPESPKSFLLSLGVAVAGAAAALGIVMGITLVALNAGSEKPAPSPTLGSYTPISSGTPTATQSGSGSPSSTGTPAGALLPVKDTSIAALNGTTKPGLARGFADRAKKLGYPVKRIEQGPATGKSTIYYRADGRDEAMRFQSQFPEFTLVAPAPASFKTDVALTVVVGDDYTPPPSATPKSSGSPT